MTLQDQIRTALSNVARRKLRSALASLGVVVGTLTIVIMVSLAAGAAALGRATLIRLLRCRTGKSSLRRM